MNTFDRIVAEGNSVRHDVEPVSVVTPPTQPTKQSRKPGFRRQVESFQPFPVDVLPKPLREFVIENARAIDCDPAYLALPVLVVLATAVGNTRRIRLKNSWTEPPTIWGAIVGNSGTRKSPALEAALRPLRDWENANNRIVANDTTIEALAALLSHNPRGLVVCRDELDGWFSSFDQYKSGKGADAANWLELHGGRPIIVDRKKGASQHIRQASCSVIGGIQPGILRRNLTTEHIARGLMARMLFVFPPPRQRRWTDADVDDQVTDEYATLVENLLGLKFDTDDKGDPVPRLVGLSREAQVLFAQFVDELGESQDNQNDSLVASMSKLEGYAARLALVIHLARWASGEQVDPDVCDAQSVEAGVTMCRWFSDETRRIHGLITETSAEAEQRTLVEIITRRGGHIRSRELQQISRRYKTADSADAALQALVDADDGYWEPEQLGKTGGRPTRQFCLNGVYETPLTTDHNRGSVDHHAAKIPDFVPDDGADSVDFDELNELFGGR